MYAIRSYYGYQYNAKKAENIYVEAYSYVSTLPKNDCTKLLIIQAIHQLNTVSETLSVIMGEMRRLSAMLPEYSAVMAMHGVGETLGPQLT